MAPAGGHLRPADASETAPVPGRDVVVMDRLMQRREHLGRRVGRLVLED
jgi:hypothetical protein